MAGLHARSRKLDIGVLKALTNFGLDLRATDNDGRTLAYHRAIAGSPTELLLAIDMLAREEKKKKRLIQSLLNGSASVAQELAHVFLAIM